MDPEQVPGGLSGVGEVLPPPPEDIPQAGSHYPLEIVPDIHPSTLGDVPPRHIIPALVILIVLFGWRPLSVFGGSFISSVRELPTRAQEELATLTTSIYRTTDLISEQNQNLSEQAVTLSERAGSLTSNTQSALLVLGSSTRDNLALVPFFIEAVGDTLSSIVESVSSWVVKIWRNIAAKWHLFLSGSNSNTQALADEKEELKAQLRAELLSELQANGTGVGALPVRGQEGIVVLPKTNMAEAERLREEAIKEVFSDQVMLISDETGRSGVVRPIFRSGVGEDYLYVMVPVNDQ